LEPIASQFSKTVLRTQPKPFFMGREIGLRPGQNISRRSTKSGGCHDAIAKAFSNVIPTISPYFDILKTVAVFCGVGLCVSLILASYGLDLSAGFF
jgi:hypothetical protein